MMMRRKHAPECAGQVAYLFYDARCVVICPDIGTDAPHACTGRLLPLYDARYFSVLK